MVERRRHKRFPLLDGIAEVVDIKFPHSSMAQEGPVPAVIVNLSAGGMGLITFVEIPLKTHLALTLDLPGLHKARVEGKVVRCEEKSGSYFLGITFVRISIQTVKLLNNMGEDYTDCEIKLSFGVNDVCFKKCRFLPLCDKDVKLKSKKK